MGGAPPHAKPPLDNESLVLDLVEWVAGAPRPYSEVMRAWRTTCPRLTVWEDSVGEGFVRVDDRTVRATARGLDFLAAHGRGI